MPSGRPTAVRLRAPRRNVVPNAVRRESTRAAVIAAAALEFAEHGYLATRLDDIVARTGMTKGAVYFHFASKEALAAEVCWAHYRRLDQLAASGRADESDPLTAAEALTVSVARASSSDPIVRAGARLARDRTLIDADLPDPHTWWVGQLLPLLVRARRTSGAATDLSPTATARTVATFFLGAQQLIPAGQLPSRVREFWRLARPALSER
jgi:AcrR family transcriptional regulator